MNDFDAAAKLQEVLGPGWAVEMAGKPEVKQALKLRLLDVRSLRQAILASNSVPIHADGGGCAVAWAGTRNPDESKLTPDQAITRAQEIVRRFNAYDRLLTALETLALHAPSLDAQGVRDIADAALSDK